MRRGRIFVLPVLCLLLSACGKDKPPTPPRLVESAKPVSVEPAKLNAAEPLLPAVHPAIPALPTPPPIASVPSGASAADLQALRGEFEHQREADKAAIDGLQGKLAGMEERLAKLESKPTAGLVADKPKTHRPRPAKPKTAALSIRRRVLPVQAKPPGQDEEPPALPFYVGSVDTWDGEKQVMVRAGGQWQGLRLGDSHQGWRIESADGQAVTVRSPQGRLWQVQAGQGG